MLYAARLAVDALEVKYEDGKSTVDAKKALHALGNLKSALSQYYRWRSVVDVRDKR